MADCPICSKGTALDPGRGGRRRSVDRTAATRSRAERRPAAAAFSGPRVSTDPYEDGEGARYVVRLERVPGGLRLGEWAGSQLRQRAPVLAAADLPRLIAAAADILPQRDAAALAEALDGSAAAVAASEAAASEAGAPGGEAAVDRGPAQPGVSRGRAGDFRDELRVEPLDGGWLRIGRWVLQPGAGWQPRDAAPMLPAARYAEALADAAARGALAALPAR